MLTVILTGGASRRMGRDKAALDLGEGPLWLSLAARYRVLGPVALSVAERRADRDEVLQLADRYPGQGPLNGLYSAFDETEAELVFLTAVDLPLGDPSLARELRSRIGDADACVIRRRDGTAEPAFAVYRRSCLEPVRVCLEGQKRSFRELFERIGVRYVREEELPAWDLDTVLMNMNTPEDYEKLLRDVVK